MADEKQIRQAQAVYDALCDMLTEDDWNFKRYDDDFTITCVASGDDLPVELRIQVDPERLIVTLLSHLPYTIAEDSRVKLAVAVSAVNYMLVDGNFDYNILNGTIIFRMTSSYRDSLIGKDVFGYMVYVACQTVDRYNDRFLMISKNMMSLDDLQKFMME